MAGTMGRYVYTTDTAAARMIKMDASNATIAGATAATTQESLNRGITPRVRYVKQVSTNRTRAIPCPAIGDDLWTAAVGTELAFPDFEALAADDFVLLGRRGEKLRA